MAKVEVRERVQNPFSMGASNDVPMPEIATRDPKALPRAAFQTPQQHADEIVNSLVNFAGVAGDLYVSRANKKIDEDTVIQTGLAALGLKPTNKATVAGVRAHAAVALKSKMLESQTKLNELAKQDLSDEDWEKVVRDEYKGVDAWMGDNYQGYKSDKEMQKLLPLSFRESMQQLTAVRLSDKTNRDIMSRINDVSDSLINMSKLTESNGLKINPEDVSKGISDSFGRLQLTSDQKDKAVLQAILNSKSRTLLEASKVWKGDRNTSLFERVESLKTLENQLDNEALSKQSVGLAVEWESLSQGLMSGGASLRDTLLYIDKKNKAMDGKFATRGAVSSLLNEYYKKVAADNEMRGIKELLSDQSLTDASSIPDKKKQAGYKALYADMISQARDEVSKLPESEQGPEFTKRVKQAIAVMSDRATTKNDTMTPFVNALSNLATSNIAARESKTETGEPVLDETTKQAILVMDSMSPTALVKHLEAVGAKEARVLRAFMAYRDRGMSEPQALSQAQSFLVRVKPTDYKKVSKGVAEVRDNLEFLWRPDFDDKQSAYLEEQVSNQIALSPEPDDESNIKLVTEWMKTGWTTSGHLRLKGSEGYLRKATGLDASKLEGHMEAFVKSQESVWKPMVESLGMDESDVFPITDPSKGTMQLIVRSKYHNANVPLTQPIPLSELPKYAAKYKEEQQKLATEAKGFDERYKAAREAEVKHKYTKGGFPW